MLKAKTTIYKTRRSGKTMYVTISADVTSDSQFPFRNGQPVEVRIVRGHLEVWSAE